MQHLWDLDFVDIGRPMGVSEVLPVTVKSLMFPTRTDASAKQHWANVRRPPTLM